MKTKHTIAQREIKVQSTKIFKPLTDKQLESFVGPDTPRGPETTV